MQSRRGQIGHANRESRRLGRFGLEVVVIVTTTWASLWREPARPATDEGRHSGPAQVGEPAENGAARRAFLHFLVRRLVLRQRRRLPRLLSFEVGLLVGLLSPKEVLPRSAKDVHIGTRYREGEIVHGVRGGKSSSLPRRRAAHSFLQSSCFSFVCAGQAARSVLTEI